MGRMRAVVLDRIGGPLEVREVPDPVPPPGGVVVEVQATGLCRSDWHAWAGHDEITLPHVPGHELAGVIAAVGPGVTKWVAGDRVTVPFAIGCGRWDWGRGGGHPGGGAGRGLRRGRGRARLPVRDRVPGADRPGPAGPGRVGHGGRRGW